MENNFQGQKAIDLLISSYATCYAILASGYIISVVKGVLFDCLSVYDTAYDDDTFTNDHLDSWLQDRHLRHNDPMHQNGHLSQNDHLYHDLWVDYRNPRHLCGYISRISRSNNASSLTGFFNVGTQQTYLFDATRDANLQQVLTYVRGNLQILLPHFDKTPLEFMNQLAFEAFQVVRQRFGTQLNEVILRFRDSTGRFSDEDTEALNKFLTYRQMPNEIVNLFPENDRESLQNSIDLDWYCRQGSHAKVKELIMKGAEVNFNLYLGRAPLVVALENGFNEIAEELVKNNAVIFNLKFGSPLQYAIQKKNVTMTTFLMRKIPCSEYDFVALYLAFKAKSERIMELIFSTCPNMNISQRVQGKTLLHIAAQDGLKKRDYLASKPRYRN